MGISDRDYARSHPASGNTGRWTGGGGEFGRRAGILSPISINSWIIGISVAVFLLQALVFVRFPKQHAFYGEGKRERTGAVLDPRSGRQIGEQIEYVARDGGTFSLVRPSAASTEVTDAQWGRRRLLEDVKLIGADRFPYHPYVDPQSQVVDPFTGRIGEEIIGKRRFVDHMDLLFWAGHFSTGRALEQAELWRFITFQFLHGNATHLLLNMLGLWFFGPIVEEHLGRRRYLAFYLMSGAAGALLYLLLNLGGQVLHIRLPGLLFQDVFTPLVGASAGVFGVLMACAYIAPRAMVQLLFPPVPLRMRTLAYGYVAIAFLSLIMGTANAGGEAAHLGGALAGFWLVRRSHVLQDVAEFFAFGEPRAPAPGRRGTAPVPTRAEEAAIDAILEKISRSGLGSLTEREKDILRRRSPGRVM